MAGGTSFSSSAGRGQSQDFELNITALIDCFTVLIAFMLVGTSFVAIGILDAGVGAAGASAIKSEQAKHLLTVEMKADKTITIKVTGQATYNKTISTDKGSWNYRELGQELSSLKAKWSDLSAATLISANTVEYQDVIKLMEVAKEKGTSILLGGF